LAEVPPAAAAAVPVPVDVEVPLAAVLAASAAAGPPDAGPVLVAGTYTSFRSSGPRM
jgi:hypothetical protein